MLYPDFAPHILPVDHHLGEQGYYDIAEVKKTTKKRSKGLPVQKPNSRIMALNQTEYFQTKQH